MKSKNNLTFEKDVPSFGTNGGSIVPVNPKTLSESSFEDVAHYDGSKISQVNLNRNI